MITIDKAKAGYRTPRGPVLAVDGVSLEVRESEILGIAGESGCGKSTLLKLIYGQIDRGITLFGGDVRWRTGNDQGSVGPDKVRDLWWDQITYVPQVVNILNPVLRIESQIFDSMPKRLRTMGRDRLKRELVEFFAELGLPETVFRAYPHQLSGGMVQRVLVGLAAFSRPRMILADEPTTALDVVSQKKILLLLRSIQRAQQNALVIVSHDLGVHYQITDRIAVCYAGKIVEIGPTREVFESPRHPYTQALVDALPRLDDHTRRVGLAGRPPSLLDPPAACRFAARCDRKSEICTQVDPESLGIGDHEVACHHALGTAP